MLAALTAAASAFAWSMIHSSGQLGFAKPGAIVAELSLADGSVKTRHRETLAWTDGITKQYLREGDRIRTLGGAHATVAYAEGLVVELDPDSQITVHGPVDAKGEQLVGAIDVVDGSIRARVATGRSVAFRDAAGREQGRIESKDGGSSQVSLKAPEQADGAIALKVLEGTKVSFVPRDGGAATVLTTGEEKQLGDATPTPSPSLVAIATATPVPPLDPAAPLPDINSEGGNVRFRRPLPSGVQGVDVRGKAASLHEGGTFEVELFDLPVGITTIDLVYRHDDGSRTRQVQRIRVR